MSAIKVVTFDCDGVMFDTEKANRAYYNDILASFGRPPMTDTQFRYAQMQTVDKSLEMLFPDKAEYREAQAYRKQNGYTPYITYMEMTADLVSVLSDLRSGYHTAVATNRTDTMKSVLEIHGIASYFDKVATALDVNNPKPAPDVLLLVLDHFHVEPAEMLYIGDSSVDEAAARSIGVRFAAFGNPELEADYHISRLAAVKDILK